MTEEAKKWVDEWPRKQITQNAFIPPDPEQVLKTLGNTNRKIPTRVSMPQRQATTSVPQQSQVQTPTTSQQASSIQQPAPSQPMQGFSQPLPQQVESPQIRQSVQTLNSQMNSVGQPMQQMLPQSVPQPVPQSVAQPVPQPVAQPVPQPVAQPVAQQQPVPQSVVQHQSAQSVQQQPVPQSAPQQSVPQSAPQQSVPQSAPQQSVPQSVPQSVEVSSSIPVRPALSIEKAEIISREIGNLEKWLDVASGQYVDVDLKKGTWVQPAPPVLTEPVPPVPAVATPQAVVNLVLEEREETKPCINEIGIVTGSTFRSLGNGRLNGKSVTRKTNGVLELDKVNVLFNPVENRIISTTVIESPKRTAILPCVIKVPDVICFRQAEITTQQLSDHFGNDVKISESGELFKVESGSKVLTSLALTNGIIIGHRQIIATPNTERKYYIFCNIFENAQMLPWIRLSKASLPLNEERWWTKVYYATNLRQQDGLSRWEADLISCDNNMLVDSLLRKSILESNCLRLSRAISQSEAKKSVAKTVLDTDRVDLTDLFCFSIDKRGTQLFDDAFSVTKADPTTTQGYGYTVLIHIADPSHIVQNDSPINKDCKDKLSDAYIPQEERVDRMLPDAVIELTSLEPNTVRCAMTVIFRIGNDGRVTFFDIIRSFIKNRCCLDMTDNMTWDDFKNETQIIKDTVPTNNYKDEAIKNATVLYEAMRSMKNHRGTVQESTQFREGPSELVQYLMVYAKEAAAEKLSKITSSCFFTRYSAPSAETFRELEVLKSSVFVSYSSERELCDSIMSLRKTAYGAAVAKYINRILMSPVYNQKYNDDSRKIVETTDTWVPTCEVPFTSPLRKYQDLKVIRMLSQNRDEPISSVDQCLLDAMSVEKKRAGGFLKKLSFTNQLFGIKNGVPTRTVLPVKCRCRVVKINIEKKSFHLYDEVTNTSWDYKIDKSPFHSAIETVGVNSAIRWKASDQVQELIPFQTTFDALLSLQSLSCLHCFSFEHRLISPEEAIGYDNYFPPMLTTDSAEPYLKFCPL